MNYILATFVSFSVATFLYLLGPIILIPVTWWIIYGADISPNRRSFAKMSLEKFLLVSGAASLFSGYMFSIFGGNEVIEEYAELASSGSLFKIGIQHVIQETGSHSIDDVFIASRNYIIYLSSITVFFFFGIVIFSRVHAFRVEVRKNLIKKNDIEVTGYLLGMLLLGFLAVAFNLVIYFLFVDPGSKYFDGLLGNILFSTLLVLIAAAETAFWFVFQRMQSAT